MTSLDVMFRAIFCLYHPRTGLHMFPPADLVDYPISLHSELQRCVGVTFNELEVVYCITSLPY